MSISDTKKRMTARAATAEIHRYVPVQLSFWADEKRAVANELARCALFRCTDTRKPREHFDNSSLYMLGEGTISYKGEELRTQDEDIFLSLVHAARDMPSGKLHVKVTSSDICKLNGWRQSQRYYNSIYLSIQRMKGGVITVVSRRLAKAIKCQRAIDAGASEEVLTRLHAELQAVDEDGYQEATQSRGEMAGMMLSLISNDPIFTGVNDIKDNIPQGNLTWEITLDSNLVALFAKPYLTLVDFETRGKLTGTGKRLQAYFASHKKPYPVKLSSLKSMLGLQFEATKDLKHYMTGQLEDLKTHSVIKDFKYEQAADGKDWLVEVTRLSAE